MQIFHEGGHDWKLQIQYTRQQDEGLYECRVSSRVPLVFYTFLHVVGKYSWHTECQAFSPVVRIGFPHPPHPLASVVPPANPLVYQVCQCHYQWSLLNLISVTLLKRLYTIKKQHFNWLNWVEKYCILHIWRTFINRIFPAYRHKYILYIFTCMCLSVHIYKTCTYAFEHFLWIGNLLDFYKKTCILYNFLKRLHSRAELSFWWHK